MLSFPDDTEIRVNGLDEILADLYSEGRQANEETVEEIVERLEEKNYIPPSARREYRNILLKGLQLAILQFTVELRKEVGIYPPYRSYLFRQGIKEETNL